MLLIKGSWPAGGSTTSRDRALAGSSRTDRLESQAPTPGLGGHSSQSERKAPGAGIGRAPEGTQLFGGVEFRSVPGRWKPPGWPTVNPPRQAHCGNSTLETSRDGVGTVYLPSCRDEMIAFDGFAAPGGESHKQLEDRVITFLGELADGIHLVFTHGGVIRMLRRLCGEERYPGWCEIVRLDWTKPAGAGTRLRWQ